jgi:hypothetical protein
LEAGIVTAQAQLKRSHEQIAVLEATTAEANARAENARLETERIKKEFAWRRLTSQQLEVLVPLLRANKAQLSQIAIVRIGDMEAQIFANDLIRAFSLAEIKVAISSGGAIIPPPYGLRATGPSAAFIKKLFGKVGVEVVDINTARDVTDILVGVKVPPNFNSP